MFEGARHTPNFTSSRAESCCDLAPSNRRRRHFFGNRFCFIGREAEEFRDRYDQIQVAGSLIEADICSQNPWTNIQRSRIEIINRGKDPSVRSRPQKSVIAQVIIDVRYQHVQGHASVQLARVISCLRSMLSQYIDEFRITSALTVLQSPHRES